MEAFELSKAFLEEFITQLDLKKEDELIPELELLFPADIAEIFDSLNLEQAVMSPLCWMRTKKLRSLLS